MGLIFSCAPQVTGKKNLPTENEIISLNGEPDSREENILDKESTMLLYGQNSYQIKNGYALMKFREPVGDEKSIQYWRHRFKNENYKIFEYNKTKHTSDYKLVHKNVGIDVFFSVDGSVVRIAEDQGFKHE